MANKLKIYTLENLTPEVKAVTFAKCSRSPESFDEIAKELNEEKSAKFHEKWVVGYGHSSVAEHAILSIAIENVSILATKVIEDCRLASYTEKSTRYQVFDRSKYYKPDKIMDSKHGRLYEETMNYLFDAYTDLMPKMISFFKKKRPQLKDETEKMHENIIKAKSCDNVRYLLPTCTLTNLGWTVNARELDWGITKLLSHSLAEMREIGRQLKEVSLKVTPTLEKYATFNNFLAKTTEILKENVQEILTNQPLDQDDTPVKLVQYDQDAEDRIVTALLYRFSEQSYEALWKKARGMNQKEKEKIIDESLNQRGQYDRPLREFEHTYYTFDILMDYGAFRDIQRHRIATQTNQELTTIHGYSTPEELVEAGFEERYRECLQKAESAYKIIYQEFPEEAQYLVPLAYKKRVLFTCNLRELHHLIPLRSSPKGHESYRRIAQLMWQEVNKVQPLLAKYIRVNLEKTVDHV